MNARIFSVRPEPRPGQARPDWIQFAIVSDECVVWIECVPALFSGWNVRSTWTQNGDEWRGMSADAIVRWKQSMQVGSPFCGTFTPATEGERAMLDRFFAQLAAA